jgi:hypothetical protein
MDPQMPKELALKVLMPNDRFRLATMRFCESMGSGAEVE